MKSFGVRLQVWTPAHGKNTLFVHTSCVVVSVHLGAQLCYGVRSAGIVLQFSGFAYLNKAALDGGDSIIKAKVCYFGATDGTK